MAYRMGIDVGGTNTDAVIVDENLKLVAEVKTPTTLDVSSGIYTALRSVLEEAAIPPKEIKYAMLGTTHATNAIVERKRLCRVAVIRLGKPATQSIEPTTGWPEDLKEAIGGNYYLVSGGHEFDGREISPFNEDEIREIAKELKGKVESIAIISVFSPITAEHEQRAGEILKSEMGEIPITYSHEIGSIGLLERENATILNAALINIAQNTAQGFVNALNKEGVTEAKVYICQNDGTLMAVDYAVHYPILTIACGPTNSIRGASFLSRVENGIVLDVGGTTSDVGVITQSFPRESSLAVEIGGVRTNFRMPDLVSIGLGGGTIIRKDGQEIKVGPDSVGYRLTEEALVFGGKTVTTTDIAVRLGLADIGDKEKVNNIPLEFAQCAQEKIMSMVEEAIDKMKVSKDPLPLILVGGGGIIINGTLSGVSEVLRPENFGVANALGAAIAQVSGEVDKIYSLTDMTRDQALDDARKLAKENAVRAGANPDTVTIVQQEDVPLAYLPGNATRIRVKAAGSLKK
ncbi:MAG TPA: hydantoinase/oxoprolinase family protein [Syntrophomonadaceae bacterium]|nr:hydantoinase/oxoprolinase family protein [Syntrophomonadaceae bacterium]